MKAERERESEVRTREVTQLQLSPSEVYRFPQHLSSSCPRRKTQPVGNVLA